MKIGKWYIFYVLLCIALVGNVSAKKSSIAEGIYILESAKNPKKVLDVEYFKYKEIANRVDNIYSQYTMTKDPQETNMMNKMMTWYGVNMKTMNDQSNSKISELLMQGTNMGIIEGRRLLNNNPSIDNEVRKILNDFVVMQEDSVETLKKYL